MKTGLKLFVITVISAVLLSLVNYITRPIITANEQAEKEAAMSAVLPGILNPVFSREILTGNTLGVTSYYTVSVQNNIVAYIFYVKGKGDQGDIYVCVGINVNGTVTGLKLVSHNETPGLGTNVDNITFLSQFNDKSGPFNVVRIQTRIPNDIVAVTSATNTSRAVSSAVNEALSFFRGMQ